MGKTENQLLKNDATFMWSYYAACCKCWLNVLFLFGKI